MQHQFAPTEIFGLGSNREAWTAPTLCIQHRERLEAGSIGSLAPGVELSQRSLQVLHQSRLGNQAPHHPEGLVRPLVEQLLQASSLFRGQGQPTDLLGLQKVQ
jgi:hypothetical protein